jgi:O-antigen/teichoic acid export membrane protein
VDEQRGRLARDVAWNLVSVVLLAVVGLGLKVLIAAWWGEGALGAFNLVTFAMMSIAILGAGGLQYAVLRTVAEAPEDRDRVAAVVVGALVPNVVLAVLATGLFVALRGPIGELLDSPAVAEGIVWAAPGLFCLSINKVLLGVVNGLRRMRAFAMYTSLRYVLIAVGLGLARALDLSGEHLPAIWSFCEAALMLVLFVELMTTVSLSRARGWLSYAKLQLAYGARGVLSTLAYEVNSKLDLWMLGIAMSDEQVGVYAMASALFEGAMQLPIILQNNLNPMMARQLADGKPGDVELLARSTRRWFVPALVVACVAGALIYPYLIPWITGRESFADGAIPFAILMGGVAVGARWLPFNQLLLMGARPGWHTFYMVGVVVVTFVLTLVLIPDFGLIGAAISSAGGMLVSAVLLIVLARTKLRVRI